MITCLIVRIEAYASFDNDSAVFVQTTNNNFVVNVDVKKIVKFVYLFDGISYILETTKMYTCAQILFDLWILFVRENEHNLI